MSPTARSLAWLRREGFLAAVVERWIPGANVRSDLWHFADLLAVRPREHTFLLVQVTSIANMSSRLAKARSRPELAVWLQANGMFEVHGWERRAGGWRLKRVGVQAEDLQPIVLQAPRRRRRAAQQPLLFEC